MHLRKKIIEITAYHHRMSLSFGAIKLEMVNKGLPEDRTGLLGAQATGWHLLWMTRLGEHGENH